MEEKILIVDDEDSIVNALAYALKREGYIIEKAYDGKEALEKFQTFNPKIVILDIMMPKISGYEICKKLSSSNVGIIMLTAKNDIVDKILGLELGADDYLTKPFDVREVIARVKSLIRRFNKETSNEVNGDIEAGNLKIKVNFREVTIYGEKLELKPKEFDILYKLLSNPGRVYSREELLDQIWGLEYIGGTRTVDTHVQRVRKKLGEVYEKVIVTVHGVGYKGERNIYDNRDTI